MPSKKRDAPHAHWKYKMGTTSLQNKEFLYLISPGKHSQFTTFNTFLKQQNNRVAITTLITNPCNSTLHISSKTFTIDRRQFISKTTKLPR